MHRHSLIGFSSYLTNNRTELILRRDERLGPLLDSFESDSRDDTGFLERIHALILAETEATYNDLFHDTSLEMGKVSHAGVK